jgi:hypothetical protein
MMTAVNNTSNTNTKLEYINDTNSDSDDISLEFPPNAADADADVEDEITVDLESISAGLYGTNRGATKTAGAKLGKVAKVMRYALIVLVPLGVLVLMALMITYLFLTTAHVYTASNYDFIVNEHLILRTLTYAFVYHYIFVIHLFLPIIPTTIAYLIRNKTANDYILFGFNVQSLFNCIFYPMVAVVYAACQFMVVFNLPVWTYIVSGILGPYVATTFNFVGFGVLLKIYKKIFNDEDVDV